MPKAQPTSKETLQKIREFAPKLMELTDDVLFGDVWARPGLSLVAFQVGVVPLVVVADGRVHSEAGDEMAG